MDSMRAEYFKGKMPPYIALSHGILLATFLSGVSPMKAKGESDTDSTVRPPHLKAFFVQEKERVCFEPRKTFCAEG